VQRHSPSVATHVPARVAGADGEIAGHTRNLSRSGVLVSVPGQGVPVGEKVQLTLSHPTTGESMDLEGVVVRQVESDGRSDAHGHPVHAGRRLRRAGSVPLFSLPTLNIAGLTLDPATRTVKVSDRPSKRLTHLEFRLLYTLMVHRGQILPADTIVERVWGYSGRGDRDLVRGLISRLRSKVEGDPRNPSYILTVPGVGYSFCEADEFQSD